MARPKSDLTTQTFRLSPDDLARLHEIAEHEGCRVTFGASVGQPDRSEAVRIAIREKHARITRKRPVKNLQENPI